MKNQADWLYDLRSQLFRKANIKTRKLVLDIGFGTGIITKELYDRSDAKIIAIDLNQERVNKAKNNYPEIDFVCADALNMPFKNDYFDMIISSWLWVWIKDPIKLAGEIKRVLKRGGIYISIAEKDSEAIIEYPQELEQKKQYLIQFIQNLGGDPFIGRKIPALFNDPDLNTQTGAFTPMFNLKQIEENLEQDYNNLESLNDNTVSSEIINKLREIELKAIHEKTRFSFAPVFWVYVVKS